MDIVIIGMDTELSVVDPEVHTIVAWYGVIISRELAKPAFFRPILLIAQRNDYFAGNRNWL